MKIEVMDNTKTKKQFPKLMIGECGEIILAIKSSGCDISGTCISIGICVGVSKCFIGEYCNDWEISYFKDFEGSITLTND